MYFFVEIEFSNSGILRDSENISCKQKSFLDSYIKKRKPYTKKLIVEPQLDYSIITDTIANLNNLTSLYLTVIITLKQSMQQIFYSLPFLNILHLDKVAISLTFSDESSYNLKFPKYLKDLKLDSFRQFNCDIIDPVTLKKKYFSENVNQLPTMEISIESLTKLHQITLQNTDQSRTPVYNQLLGNLTQLKRYNTVISCMNNDSLSIISKNSNLTTLRFDFF